MSQKNYKDLEAEIVLERIENKPKLNEISKGTILAKNSRGLYLDINKCFEGFLTIQELGSKSINDFSVGEQIEILLVSEDRNQEGVYKVSIKEIEQKQKWQTLESLKGQNLELTITKVIKSGVEVKIKLADLIGFIPFAYIDPKQEGLKNIDKEKWVGYSILGRIHELDESKNKIIINNKVICDELKEIKAAELINSIALGSEIECEVVRIADFGVFVDIGGFDALIPSSELSWRRFRRPADVVKVGEKIKAKVFKIEAEQKRIALSVKQANPDPWTVLPTELQAGYKTKAKVVTQAEFGIFVEVMPGVEALLHKSNYTEESKPEIGSELDVEIINVDASKKRMGVKLQQVETAAAEATETEKKEEATIAIPTVSNNDDNDISGESPKELEHV